MKSFVGRGFVLSFAVLTLGLFILILAQLQAEQQFSLRIQNHELWQTTLPFRFGQDAKMDLNTILDERLTVDQNSVDVNLFIQGQLPSSLDVLNNLLRYQTGLAGLARDLNLLASMDLNNLISDGNVVGRTSSNFQWKKKLSSDEIIFHPSTNFNIPNRIDVNIYSGLPYTSMNPWSLDSNGDVFVVLNYSDQNTSHDFNSTGWFTAAGAIKTYSLTYGSGSSQLNISVGKINRLNGSFWIDNTNPSALTVQYAVKLHLDANTGYTRVGYDIPLTIMGTDANVVETTQWIIE